MITTLLGNAVLDAAESRHSIRRYTDRPVSDEAMTQLLEAAGHAPSAYNVQPWRWVAVRDPELKAMLQAAAYGQPQVGAAPVLLVLYTDTRDALEHIEETFSPTLPAEKAAGTKAHLLKTLGAQSAAEREGWGAGQSYIALGYLLLIAESLGLGTSPMLGFDPEKVKSILGLPAYARVPALVAVGYPAEEGFDSPRHAVERVLTWR
ncbi:MAG TPA: nitroreductase family protein [Gemmatimonadales bacterium]|nr:nitroreductase family protein [Gemmatimonadales bacterium]